MGWWRRHRIELAAVATIVAAIGFVAAVFAINQYLDPFDDLTFTSAAWAAAKAQNRGPMARNAIERLPPGTAATQVRELLGKPDSVFSASGSQVDKFGHRWEQAETWSYYLGSWSGIGPYALDDASLYVEFDADGRVVAARITGG